jgi:hypothetical protein
VTLDEARKIVASEDMSDLPKALEAMAIVLRFHGIADKRLIDVATLIEEAAAMPPTGKEKE